MHACMVHVTVFVNCTHDTGFEGLKGLLYSNKIKYIKTISDQKALKRGNTDHFVQKLGYKPWQLSTPS